MSLQNYLSFIAYACAVTFLPGPNNILLLSAAGQTGFKKCLPLLTGIWTGLIAVMTLAGAFCTVLGEFIPSVQGAFKYAGAAYILYLAWKTFTRKPVDSYEAEVKHLRFIDGFLLQFLNVKVIMLGLAAFPAFFLPYSHGFIYIALFAVTMTACCGAGNLLWTFAGSLIAPFYDRHYRLINTIMALLLLYCVVKVIM